MARTAPEGVPVAVIAGGAGFLGSHLAEALLAQGQQVVVLDNYTTGREDNLKSVLHHPDFSYKIGDINQGLPDLARVDYIYHLAGVEEYINGTDVSVETLLVNSIGTRNLLDLAKAHHARILLASSVDVYSGVVSSLSLEHYFGKNHRDAERFSQHEAKRYAEALTTEYFRKFTLDARIVRIKDVYGPRMDLRAGTEMAELLAEALQPEAQQLTIHGDGLKVLHPTYVADVIYGLIKAMGEGTDGRIYHLVNPDPQTVLNFASRLRKVASTHPKLIFTDEIDETTFPPHRVDFIASSQALGWRPLVGIEEGLKRTLAFFTTRSIVPEIPDIPLVGPELAPFPSVQVFNPALQPFSGRARLARATRYLANLRRWGSAKPSPGGRNIRVKFTVVLLLVFIGLAVVVPVGGVLAHVSYGTWRLKGSQSYLLSGQADSAFAAASDATGAFAASQAELTDLSWLLRIVGLNGSLDTYQTLLGAAAEVSTAAQYSSTAVKPLVGIGQQLVATDVTAHIDPAQTTKDLTAASTQLELANDHLARADTLLNQVNSYSLPWFAKDQLGEVRSKITGLQTSLKEVRGLAAILPSLTGLNSWKNYLLLFMNNNELRPGGGFIGSYGLTRFEGGKMRELLVDDVYNPDGQLKQQLPVPLPLQTYLGVGNLGLRDSNWSPDFPTWSALSKSIFYQETHRQVDGVIALDMRTLQNLLRVIGPVTVADYNETVTADNFFDRAQYHAEVGFFPGSTGKKDFISAVASIVLDKILHSSPSGWGALAAALQTSLNDKDVLINMNDSSVQKLVNDLGWSGALDPVAAPTTDQVNDYLMTVDANVGANKANYFVKTATNYQVDVSKDGILDATLTIRYQHTATTETWPSGKYKDYLRVYVPKGAAVKQVALSDSQVTPQVTTTEENGRTVFGMYLEIPSQSVKTLTITYGLPDHLPSISKPTKYLLTIQKQAGIGSPPLSVNFNLPSFLQGTAAGAAYPSPNAVRINSDLATDHTFTVNVTP